EHPVDIRILSASHKNLAKLVKQGQFREDLFYRINVIELEVPSLRERVEDIPVLADFFLQQLSSKTGLTKIPRFTAEARHALINYQFPGNVRELENILERALALTDGETIDLVDLQLPRAKQLDDLSQKANHPPTLSSLADQEQASILEALDQTRWNKTAAAKQLGLTLRQLRYRLSKLGIN
ncbi:MAG: sigma 54-interacting transcriptional regulator, partial [Gammaproteobacteria bacterium]|nr:sigma 54-interacting transcriptional regulator [Gammaproteobacteria bacterium]